jgi:hypothetical protein
MENKKKRRRLRVAISFIHCPAAWKMVVDTSAQLPLPPLSYDAIHLGKIINK